MAKVREFTDPTVYASQHLRFEREGLPTSQAGWVQRARDVAEILAQDAGQRDIENKAPRAEISLLKSAGLLKVLGPTKYGGGGQSWETGYKVIREIARGDGSLGMLLGYHLLWSVTANVVGTDEQAESIQEVIITNNYFVGGAVNPRDSDLKITSVGEELVFNGFKNFSTGGVISDLTVLEGVLEGTEDHIFTLVNTAQPGLQFSHNWDAVGLRLTESGSVRVDNIHVPWTDALGWDPTTKRPIPEILGIPFATLLLPTIQLVFSNFYIGIAEGALAAAAKYTATQTRAWPYGGDNKEHAADEFYILERYGDFRAHLAAADALADRAGAEIATLYAQGGHYGASIGTDAAQLIRAANPNYTATLGQGVNGVFQKYTNGSTPTPSGTDPLYTLTSSTLFQSSSSSVAPSSLTSASRSNITPHHRGTVAATVAQVKILGTDTGLRVAGGIFELLGARATARKYGFDRFWRDVRTHTLHDPVAYKKREVGRWQLLGEIPEPTWYT